MISNPAGLLAEPHHMELLQAGVSIDIVASTLNLSKNELERLIQA